MTNPAADTKLGFSSSRQPNQTMAGLSTDQVLKEKQTRDPNSITSLSLTHKALADVSCLNDFKNLERLDLGFNSLTSLEGLNFCLNLKWLSVVQNKLQSLKGIEGLSKLTVLNAGKNKLRSMDEVMSLVSLRALILNDNEIISICKLDQKKDLNTLVLSRNPIREIGESLLKLKSITKLSLSNCQVQIIGSSLKSCTELKELRLAHNDIKTLPAELAYNKKLQNLDLGNNLITKLSEIKVLNSLVNLKNLNLRGNPIAENDKLTKKVGKLLPNLHVFNTRPIDKNPKIEKEDAVDMIRKIKKRDHNRETNDRLSNKEIQHDKNDLAGKKLKKKATGKGELDAIDDKMYFGDHMTGQKKDGHLNDSKDVDMEKDLKPKRKKTIGQFLHKDIPVDDDDKGAEKKQKKKSKEKPGELDVIDDGETSFSHLFSANIPENPRFGCDNNIVDEAFQLNSVDGLVTSSAKRKKAKNGYKCPTLQSSQDVEIGLGGPSTWGDD